MAKFIDKKDRTREDYKYRPRNTGVDVSGPREMRYLERRKLEGPGEPIEYE